MKVICELNDRLILGKDGLSSKTPRLAARAVLKNKDGLFAVMYAAKHNLYTLPGGGLEDGEDAFTAVKREILEETGCVCDEVNELGIVLENRGSLDFTQVNYYFAVRTEHEAGECHLSQAELEDRTSLQWHTFQDLVRLINEQPAESVQKEYIKGRDGAALGEYEKVFVDI